MLRKYNKTLTVALTAIALATASLAATSDAFAGGGGKGGGGGGGKGGGGGWGHHHHHGFGGFYAGGGGTCWFGCGAPWSTSAIDLAPHGTPARCLCTRAGVLCAYGRQAWVVRLPFFRITEPEEPRRQRCVKAVT